MDRSTKTLVASLVLHALLWWWLSLAPPPGGPPPAPTEVTYLEPKTPGPRAKPKTQYIDKSPKPKTELEDVHDTAPLISNLDRRYKKQTILPRLGPEITSPAKAPQRKADDSSRAGEARDEAPREEGRELVLPRMGSTRHQPAMGPSSTGMRVPWVEFGDMNVLNSDRNTYYVFYERMGEQVGNRWSGLVRELVARTPAARLEEMARQDRRTQVEIILDAQGDFVRAIFEKGSGFEDLDYTGVEAFRMATPFINPPRGMVGADGLIHVHVNFEIIMRPPMMGGGY